MNKIPSDNIVVKRVYSKIEILSMALAEAIDALGYLDEFYDDKTGGPVTPRGESPTQLADRLQLLISKNKYYS